MGKKFISLCLCLLFMFTISINAAEYSLLYVGGYAKVLEVIDGDSIKVKTYDTGEIALVRFAGIDAKGYDEAVKYLNNTILGKRVIISFDPGAPMHINGRWNNMLVKYNGELINGKLVHLGYAVVSESYAGLSLGTLQSDEENARRKGQGLWDDSPAYENHYPQAYGYYYTDYYYPWAYSGGGVNINTASVSKLREHMPDAPQSVATAIVSYRAENPFNDVYEIKFVPGFTRSLFDKYRNVMTVCTNINTASDKELLTLGSITSSEADRIIYYRDRNGFGRIEDLYNNNLISRGLFDSVRDYISIGNISRLSLSVPDKTVYLNSASHDELVGIGLSSSQADIIISGRKGYSYKTLGELKSLPGLSFTDYDLNKYEDNLLLNNYGDYININFAGVNELISLGFTQSEAASIYSNRRRMNCPADIPVDISKYEGRISLYTNINKATLGELEKLGIAPQAASAIISYRNNQPFGSLGELQDLFYSLSYGGGYYGYSDIRDFITVR